MRGPRYLATALVVLVSCACVGASSVSAAGEVQYRVIDLGGLGGFRQTFTVASAINDRGQVVGFSDTNTKDERDARSGERIGHAFLWEKGKMLDLGTLGGLFSRAADINNRGQIVGCSTTKSGDRHAFLWENGKMRDLGTPAGGSSCASAINNRGQIVGSSGPNPGGGRQPHGFLWEKGRMVDLDRKGGTSTDPFGVNDSGQIVGWQTPSPVPKGSFATARGVLLDRGHFRFLGTLGGMGSSGQAINQQGSIVGFAETAKKHSLSQAALSHAALWRAEKLTDLGTLGGSDSVASAINNAGSIVGEGLIPTDSSSHAFIWAGARMTDIGILKDFANSGARGINRRGQIVGYATNGSPGLSVVGKARFLPWHAVLWTPRRG